MGNNGHCEVFHYVHKQESAMRLFFTCLFCLIPVFYTLATEKSEFFVTDSILEPAALNFVSGQFGTCINGQTFQIEAVTSYNNWQYATYFDAKKRLCVARRELPTGPWQRITFDDYTINHTDVHNVAVIGICPRDGTIHLAFDHHGHPLRYRISIPNAATNPKQTQWTTQLFSPTTSELVSGQQITRVTYPAFVNSPNGKLILFYRTGGSGNGQSQFAEYDPTNTPAWTLKNIFIDSKGDYNSSSTRNAYHNGFDFTADGKLHTTWVWREGADMGQWGILNCHDLMYAYSPDEGKTWHNNVNKPIAVAGQSPINIDSPKLCVFEVRWRWGLMNQLTQTVDSKGRVHVILWHHPPDADVLSRDQNTWRYFHYWRDMDGQWHRQQLPCFGRKPSLLAGQNDNLILVFTKPDTLVYHQLDPGGPLHIFTASADNQWKNWSEVFRSEKHFVGEPRVDKQRWLHNGTLSIYAQEAPPSPGLPSHLHVMDFQGSAEFTEMPISK